MANWRSMAPILLASQSSGMAAQDHQQLQQRKFFDAFQAAVDQHTGVSNDCAPSQILLTSLWDLLFVLFAPLIGRLLTLACCLPRRCQG